MNNITAIIPLHEFNDTVKSYLEKCLLSINNQIQYKFYSTNIVVNDEILNDVTEFVSKYSDVNVLLNKNGTTFQSNVNYGIKSLETTYFTIIEFDDEISSKYLSNMVTHIESYPNVDIYMPIILEINDENKKVKDTNIQAWSKQLVGEDNEVGYLNNFLLTTYTDFKLSGSVINKDTVMPLGGFKENIKFSFILEYLLRCVKNNVKAYVVPKILYKHLNNREGSMTNYFLNNLSKNDLKFWFEKAISESDYFMDREINE